MNEINLSTIPNQSFFVVIDGNKIDFRLHMFRDILYADVSVNENAVANSVRCVSDGLILPERFNKTVGNFAFHTLDGVSYPNPDDFGTTCFLQYFPPDEIENG